MDECSKCGVTADKARLYDAISSQGIVKLCDYCSDSEGIPVVKRPTTFQLKEAERKAGVYERLSKMAGVQKGKEKPKSEDLIKQERNLKFLADRNYVKQLPTRKEPRADLIDNFHWVIMMARRSKKITQEQMAKEIGESEAAIKMAEQGNLPEDDYNLINKLEWFLGIKLIKQDVKEELKTMQKDRKIKLNDFKDTSIKGIKVEDLKNMKKEKEKNSLMFDDDLLEDSGVNRGSELDDGDLEGSEKKVSAKSSQKGDISKEEIDRILYGK